MVKAYPEEFRRDVIAVARQGETSVRQVAKDFGIVLIPKNENSRSSAVRDEAERLAAHDLTKEKKLDVRKSPVESAVQQNFNHGLER